MKRRSFLKGAAGFLAATKVAMAGEPAPTPVPVPEAPVRTVKTLGKRPKANLTPWLTCKAFAKKYDLDLRKHPDAEVALFSLKGPFQAEAGFSASLVSKSWSTGLRHHGLPVNQTGGLVRQLRYQMLKTLQGIEKETGWTGFPPGVNGNVAWKWEKGNLWYSGR